MTLLHLYLLEGPVWRKRVEKRVKERCGGGTLIRVSASMFYLELLLELLMYKVTNFFFSHLLNCAESAKKIV